MNWETAFGNPKAQNMYVDFVAGKVSRRQMEEFFKNTEFAGPFRALVRNGGAKRAKEVARKALSRRALV